MKNYFGRLLHECRRRRADLAGMIGAGSVAVLPAATRKQRSHDVYYPFRQNSDFYYLTGFAEPDALLVLISQPASTCHCTLFCSVRNADDARWHGARCGPDAAVAEYGMDEAYSLDRLEALMPELLAGRDRVYCPLGRGAAFDQRLISWLHTGPDPGKRMPDELVDIAHLLHELRLFKSRFELQLMQAAADITCRAHVRAMQAVTRCRFEHEVMAELLYEYHRNGCEAAYPPIVGSGENACVLHYTNNDQALGKDHLLLVDAGCEYRGYASDITRTYPVSGRFTEDQKAIYNIVLKAQHEAISKATPAHDWDAVHQAAARVICAGLCDLGILKNGVGQALEAGDHKRYFMHKTGHWLGLDVHDVGDYRLDGQARQLEPGMVMTVEPGIYIPAGDEQVAARWRGLGVRIEDDVVITRSRARVLSQALPAAVDDVEALIRG